MAMTSKFPTQNTFFILHSLSSIRFPPFQFISLLMHVTWMKICSFTQKALQKRKKDDARRRRMENK